MIIMKKMPKDETIKRWIKTYSSKKAFEKEMLRRLDIVEAKKAKIRYILKRLKTL